jgi:carbon-monoxide dehydrogenase medium subunit
VKPKAFGYLRPETLEEALGLLARHGLEAKVLAGGQSLVPLLNFRLAAPRYLVDVNGLTDLAGIRAEGEEIVFGALARQAAAERHPGVAQAAPLLRQALAHVGHPPIRARGTVVGSLAHADPAAELPVVFTALGGSLTLASTRGRRVIPAEAFFQGPMLTALEPDEMVVEARLPTLVRGSRTAFLELARRRGDFALVAVAAVRLPGGEVRLGIGGAGPKPFRPRDAEVAARDGRLREAAELAARASAPEGDLHAPAEYRRAMVQVLTERALRRVFEASRGEEG